MIKILNTGDLHLGKKYASHREDIGKKYSLARFEALKKLISTANEQHCDYIIAAGDVFDTKNTSVSDISLACNILGNFEGSVIVIPGNHDYYEGKDDRLWTRFLKEKSENTMLLTENKKYAVDDLVLYPAICHSKHSGENAIGWIKSENIPSDDEKIHIGIAHGSIDGISPDPNREYFPMSIDELNSCNVDLWLIGHTHVPYPSEPVLSSPKILNAGTHQQTDIADNSEGSAFLVSIDDGKKITAERIHTGVLRFVRLDLTLTHGDSLENALENILSEYQSDAENISVRINISGIALKPDYDRREELYDRYKNCFIDFEVFDNELNAEITSEMIDAETNAGSIENELLKKYINEPDVLNLAFDLIKKCKECE